MTKLSLAIKEREEKNNDRLRGGGWVPAVFYGRKEKSTPIMVKLGDFMKIWNEAGESILVTLKGVGSDKDSLIQEVATHPVTEVPLHADFYIIEKDRKIEVSIPLNFTGEAPVEKAGLVVIKVLHELEVESLPGNLPHQIDVDLSGLESIEDHILVKDLKLPEGVLSIAEPDEVVVSVSEAREEEPEEELEEIDMEGIEVEKKGKKEEVEEGAEERDEEEEEPKKDEE